jgi:hypothetical protein
MTKAQPRPGQARTDVVSAGNGQVTGPAGITVRAYLRAALIASGLLIVISALLLATLTGARLLTIALVAVRGLGFGAVPVAAQSWMARAMPGRRRRGPVCVRTTRLAGGRAGGRRRDL